MDLMDELFLDFTSGPNDESKKFFCLLRVWVLVAAVCAFTVTWLRFHPAIRRHLGVPIVTNANRDSCLNFVRSIYRYCALIYVWMAVFVLLACKRAEDVGFECLGPARNRMEEVLWRFGDYGYMEFVGCVIVVGVMKAILFAAGREDGGRELHFWIDDKIHEMATNMRATAIWFWKLTMLVLENIGRDFIDYWTRNRGTTAWRSKRGTSCMTMRRGNP